MTDDDQLQSYYARDRERDRLAAGLGALEFLRTTEIVERTLPSPPAVVADIGGGPGRYTDWLVKTGYGVVHRDLVPHHVDQVRARHGSVVDTVVGDARSLDLSDAVADATLHLGPLYHLASHDDREAAIAEAVRITKPGGMVYVAAIGRWAARLQGLLVEQLYRTYPETVGHADHIEATGVLAPVFRGAFTAFTHSPELLRAEMNHPGLELLDIVAIEGPATMFADDLIDDRLANDLDRTVLLDSLRAVESAPDLLGVSSHLLAVARKRSA